MKCSRNAGFREFSPPTPTGHPARDTEAQRNAEGREELREEGREESSEAAPFWSADTCGRFAARRRVAATRHSLPWERTVCAERCCPPRGLAGSAPLPLETESVGAGGTALIFGGGSDFGSLNEIKAAARAACDGDGGFVQRGAISLGAGGCRSINCLCGADCDRGGCADALEAADPGAAEAGARPGRSRWCSRAGCRACMPWRGRSAISPRLNCRRTARRCLEPRPFRPYLIHAEVPAGAKVVEASYEYVSAQGRPDEVFYGVAASQNLAVLNPAAFSLAPLGDARS